jgi:hypothetical protein
MRVTRIDGRHTLDEQDQSFKNFGWCNPRRDPIDQTPQWTVLPRWTHVQLGDVSFLIQQERGEGRWDLDQKHDGVVAMLEVLADRGSLNGVRKRVAARWGG